MAGKADSSWHVLRRCLVILRRMQQGPTTWQGLLSAVIAADPEAYGNGTDDQQRDKIKRDIRRIRNGLQIDASYVAGHGYAVQDWGDGILDLTDEELRTLAFLRQTFNPDAPYGKRVGVLVDNLTCRFSAERRHQFDRMTNIGPDIDFRLRDEREIAPDVWEAVYKAWSEKRELEFEYLKAAHEGQARYHCVQPWQFYFSERGRYMLKGFCLVNDGPNGRWEPRQYVSYRLHNIVGNSARVLPRKLPHTAPRGKLLDVMLEIAPEIGVFGLSQRPEWVGGIRSYPIDDGWMRVEGRIEQVDLFAFSRNLLFYAGNCRVVGGDRLLETMHNHVDTLHNVYFNHKKY